MLMSLYCVLLSFECFSFSVVVVAGALYITTISFVILHLWGGWQEDFFRIFAFVAYLAYSFIIAALRTQVKLSIKESCNCSA